MEKSPGLIDESFIYFTDAWILVIGLFVMMLACIYVGRKMGLRKAPQEHEAGSKINGTIVSSMIGLLAFLMAFTFGMSGTRFDDRRTIVVDEANAIGTAILRADLYPENQRLAFREDFKIYLEARINYYEAGDNLAEIFRQKQLADDYGKKLWDRATSLSHDQVTYLATLQMVPALNEMLDVSTTRLIRDLSRVPDSIVYMLFALSLASAFFLGYESAEKAKVDWFLAVGFCMLTSVVIFITLDLDRPRRGLIQMKTPQKAMLELRKNF